MATKYIRAEDTPFVSDSVKEKATSKKSRKKMYLFIGVGIFSLFVFFIILMLFAGSGNKRPSPELTPTKVPSEITPTISKPTPTSYDSKTVIINGVEVNDFKETAQGMLPNGNILIVRNDDYQITYAPQTEEFAIIILNKNFLRTRNDAEGVFIKLLGISEKSACGLTVTVGSPSHVNSRYAGLSFPLSFCK